MPYLREILLPHKQKKLEEKEERNEAQKKQEIFEPLFWQAPEYTYYRKSNDWYWALGILVIGLLVVAYITSNFLFGILVLVGGFALGLYSARKPRIIRCGISHRGIEVDTLLFPYTSLKSFWIFYDPPEVKELSLEGSKIFMPAVKVPLGNTNPVEVRKILIRFLLEQHQEESLVDILARRLRF